MRLRDFPALAQGLIGGKWHSGGYNLVSDFGAYTLNTSQLLLLSSTCPATSLGAMWLGLQSLTSLYYQTATDMGTWYISRELKLTLNLWIVFKACLKLVKPAILVSKDMDHKALQKVSHLPRIKFWHKANNRLGSEQLWRAGHGCCIIIHVFL